MTSPLFTSSAIGRGWTIAALIVSLTAALADAQPAQKPGDIHSRTRRLDPDTGSREASGTTMPYRRDTVGGPRISERGSPNEDPDDVGATRPSLSDSGEYKLDAIGGPRISTRGTRDGDRAAYERARRIWLEANAGDRREDDNVHQEFNPRDHRPADMGLWLEARGTRGLVPVSANTSAVAVAAPALNRWIGAPMLRPPSASTADDLRGRMCQGTASVRPWSRSVM